MTLLNEHAHLFRSPFKELFVLLQVILFFLVCVEILLIFIAAALDVL